MANKLENRHKEHKGEPAHQKQETKSQCRHYWIIEAAEGPTSKGVCKYCGAEKEFQNSWAESLWDGDMSSLLNLPGLPGIGPETDEES